jgi:hypothetical protein
MGIRTFVVRVSETDERVVVEDVRSRERLVARDLTDVAEAIGRLLEGPGQAYEGSRGSQAAHAAPKRRPAT